MPAGPVCSWSAPATSAGGDRGSSGAWDAGGCKWGKSIASKEVMFGGEKPIPGNREQRDLLKKPCGGSFGSVSRR